MDYQTRAPLSPPTDETATTMSTTTPAKEIITKVEHTSPPASQEAATAEAAGDDSVLSTSTPDEKHPKGKRKRTAAKDKGILEEAYMSNPKPDKQARLDIVERVSLNEKEVQIWFQNRRQNDRRKSRPLSAEEVASMRYSGPYPQSSEPNNVTSSFHHSAAFSSDPLGPEHFSFSSPNHNAHLSNEVLSTPMPASQAAAVPGPAPTPITYLANRRNLGSAYSTPISAARSMDHSFGRESWTGGSFNCSPDTSFQSARSQSNVRLSFSLEGKAEVVPNTFSPDRLPPVDFLPPRTLQRSQSAITLPPVSSLIKATRRPSMRGRSRDVEAWASAARAEPHDELTAMAESESTGSAIAAISLLRSASNCSTSSILQPSGSAKRNASLSRPKDADPIKKRKFNRAISSVARLESGNGAKVNETSGVEKLKVARLLSPTDSDKENLSPDEEGNPRRRALEAAAAATSPTLSSAKQGVNPRRTGAKVLGENANAISRANVAHVPRKGVSGKDADIAIFDDSQQPQTLKTGAPKLAPAGREGDEENARPAPVSPSKKPDMDCVAGLLSLSQGAWR